MYLSLPQACHAAGEGRTASAWPPEWRSCADVATLKARLRSTCAAFGTLQRLDVLTSVHEGRQQAICFLRLATPEQEQALMKALGVGRFGGEIVFVVDLQAPPRTEESGPSSVWADLGAV